MAVLIVDALELVDIQQQQRQRLAPRIAGGELLGQELIERYPIGQSGKAVGRRLDFQLLILLRQRAGLFLKGRRVLLGLQRDLDQRLIGFLQDGIVFKRRPDVDLKEGSHFFAPRADLVKQRIAFRFTHLVELQADLPHVRDR